MLNNKGGFSNGKKIIALGGRIGYVLRNFW
jgi:hypothetical protein